MNHKERPWGSFIVLQTNFRYQVKKSLLHAGASFLLPRHNYLAEHWFMAPGLGLPQLENEVIKVQQGKSVDTPIEAKPRITYAPDHPLFLWKSRLESVFIKTILLAKKKILAEDNV